MSAAFTFGSLGDIMAITELVYRLCQALNDSRGSAKQYLELRKDLDGFGQCLVQVITSYEICDSTAWLRNIDNITISAVDDCARTIQEALDLLAKYDSSLRAGGSGNCVKDTFRKIQWLAEKEKIDEFRQKLKMGTERIMMLLTVASK
jgi:hypothetical protein